jgi:hypothetical protein
MNWIPPTTKKKAKPQKSVAIRGLRGKYKRLDLMRTLMQTRKQDRHGAESRPIDGRG